MSDHLDAAGFGVDERAQLINFCSGRSRLPASASDFHMTFKLTAPPPRSEKDPDDYLPIARTCFFSLSLPKYSSVQVRFLFYVSCIFAVKDVERFPGSPYCRKASRMS